MKLFLIFVISVLLLQAFVACSLSHGTAADFAEAGVEEESDVMAVAKKHHPKKINCGHACSRRCKESSRKNVCHRACKTCCHRCNCVPPGTYGNKHLCPCYARLRTHGNKPKCP